MPIAKRPQGAAKVQQDDKAAETFITGAAKRQEWPKRKRKERVMTQFDDAVLERVDAAARRRGISRSAWIQFVVSRALDQGEG